MKRYSAFLLCLLLSLFSACSSRSASGPLSEQESPADTPSVPSVLEQPNELPSNLENAENSAESEKNDDESDDSTDEKEENSQDELGDSQSGTFFLFDSDYEITLTSPFSGIYDELAGGFYITATNDPSLQGIVSYTDSAEEIKAIEDNITVLNDTLKNDDNVKDFQYDRSKDSDGRYSITFTYRNIGDEYSASGYNYVLYRQTDGGMITVMFTAQDNSYSDAISAVYASVQPAGDTATEAPRR